jgi:hypothetical protein
MSDYPITSRREAIITRLGNAWAEDTIDEAEFERRVSAAIAARDAAELEQLVADLPQRVAVAPRQAALAIAPYQQPAMLRRVMLSSVDERVHDVMPPLVEYGVRLASLELDFRDAVFNDGVTEIIVDVLLGNVELTMPPDVTVEMRVDGLLSSVEYKNRSRLTQPAHRIVRITGKCVLGTVDVSTRDPRPPR